MKKRIMACLCGILLLATAVGMIGCGGGSGGNSGDLVLWAGGQWIGEDAENLQDFIDYVNENYSGELGFEVKLEIKENLDVIFPTSLTNNSQPDLLLWGRNQTAEYASTDNFVNLDSYIEDADIDLSEFYEPALREGTYNDSVYVLPMDVDPWGLIINMEIVREINKLADDPSSGYVALSEDGPATWSEFITFGKMFRKYYTDKNQPVSSGYPLTDMSYHSFFSSAGWSFMSDPTSSSATANFDSDVFRDFIDVFLEMRSVNVDCAGVGSQTEFCNGSLAMMSASSYRCRYVSNYFGGDKVNGWKYVAQPAYDVDGEVQEGAKRGGLMGGFGWAIPQSGEQYRTEAFYERVDMAWEFIRLTVTEDNLLKNWVNFCGSIPALEKAQNFEEVTGTQYLAEMAEIAENCDIRPQQYFVQQLDAQFIAPAMQELTDLNTPVSNWTTEKLDDFIRRLNNNCNDFIEMSNSGLVG